MLFLRGLSAPAAKYPLGLQLGEEAFHLLERHPVVLHRVGGGDVEGRVRLGQELPGVVQEETRVRVGEVTHVAVRQAHRAAHHRRGFVGFEAQGQEPRLERAALILPERNRPLDGRRQRQQLWARHEAFELLHHHESAGELVESGQRRQHLVRLAAEDGEDVARHRVDPGVGKHPPARPLFADEGRQKPSEVLRQAEVHLHVDGVMVQGGDRLERVGADTEVEGVLVGVKLAGSAGERLVERDSPALDEERRHA